MGKITPTMIREPLKTAMENGLLSLVHVRHTKRILSYEKYTTQRDNRLVTYE